MSEKRKDTPDPNAYETRKIAAVRPPSDARIPAASEEPQHSHPTVVLAKVISLRDIPVLAATVPVDGASSELRMLLAAIDGTANVAEIAEVAGMIPEQARAMIAALKSDGLVTVTPSPTPSSPNVIVEPTAPFSDERDREPRPPEYWLGGLKPRTGK